MKEKTTKSNDEYEVLAEAAWDRSWGIINTEDSWKKEAGHDIYTGLVTARYFNDLGKVFRLQSYVDATPEMMFEILVAGVIEWPKWNPTILDCKHIQEITENTDIAYSIGAPGAGGLVSSRDFVNLRHWKTKNDIMLASACATTHGEMPPTKKHVRAENHPACYVFEKVEDNPQKCFFTCVLSTDLKGWLPHYVVNQALSGVLMDYLKALNQYVIKLKEQRIIQESS